MNEDFNELIKIFKQINNQGYIKGVSNNLSNACGLTFEHLINKKPDSKYLPDFKSVEIKTTQRFSHFPISLFSLKFNGPSSHESTYLLERYGKIDPKLENKKILTINLKINEKVSVYGKYYFELNMDYLLQRIFIKIYDANKNYIEERAFINFDFLNERINAKIQSLALIFGSKKVMNNNLYFRYYQIKCYKYKDFNTFINLIVSGDIKLTLMLRFSKSVNDNSSNKNKNMIFRIDKNSLDKLFNKIYSYEN